MIIQHIITRFSRATMSVNSLQRKISFQLWLPRRRRIRYGSTCARFNSCVRVAVGRASSPSRVRRRSACASCPREALLEPGGAGVVSPGQDGGAVLHTLVAGGCGNPAAAGCSGDGGPAAQGGRSGGVAGPQAERCCFRSFPGNSRPRGAADIETRCQPHR